MTVYWAPWAAKWFEDVARRRDLVRTHEERMVKNALRVAKWRKRKRQDEPEYFDRVHTNIRRERRLRRAR